ncbi:MAG: methyltransferase domain-containing protein [Acidimicrobiia bacterium]
MEIDLERLSASYKYRPLDVGAHRRVERSARGLAGTALDIGGGPGGHAGVLEGLGLTPVVVDLSLSMCRKSHAKGLEAICCLSERLPVRDDAVVLCYFHLSIHYGRWRSVLDEAIRVTAPGGRIEIWTFTHEALRSSSLATWFPSVGDIDCARFPEPDEIVKHLEAGGAQVHTEHRPENVERGSGDWVTAVENRFVSTLQLVPEAELRAGLDEFQAVYPDPDAVYRYTLDFLRISATV